MGNYIQFIIGFQSGIYKFNEYFRNENGDAFKIVFRLIFYFIGLFIYFLVVEAVQDQVCKDAK